MYTYEQVYEGIEKYIEREILHKIPGWKKWVVGTGLELAIANGENIYKELKEYPLVKMLNVIDEGDHINVIDIYKCLKKRAEQGSITFEIPMIGEMTLNKDDVDKLYYYITE